MNAQELSNEFNKLYIKASHTSQPADWMEAALIARQLVEELAKEGSVVDNWEEELVRQEGEVFTTITHSVDVNDNNIENLIWVNK